jgi:hypothetical protein
LISGWRLGLLAALAAATAAVAAAPGPLGRPIRGLAAFHADGSDPLWDVPVDAAALRRAGRILPDRTTYAVYAPQAGPVLAGNLKAAGQLFFSPALPVQSVSRARWVLSYRAGRVVPPGVRASRVVRLGSSVYLVRAA